MSRVGKVPVKIQPGVKVEIKDSHIKVEGPKGKLSHTIPRGVSAKVVDGAIIVSRHEEIANNAAALHGLTRTLIHNMVQGVAVGFSKELDVVGVGYRAAVKGTTLSMTLGYSHPVDYVLPAGITGKVDGNTHITVTGADKNLVGMVAAKIRSFREPEPYQGKGIKYTSEHIVRKQGKAAGAK
jgi:large subunit ribosomal protein L6